MNIGAQPYTDRDLMTQVAAELEAEAQRDPSPQNKAAALEANRKLMQHITREHPPGHTHWHHQGWVDRDFTRMEMGHYSTRAQRPAEYFIVALETGDVGEFDGPFPVFAAAHKRWKAMNKHKNRRASRAGLSFVPTLAIFARWADGHIERADLYHRVPRD